MADDASPAEIRAAYRQLMREVHPDVANSANGVASQHAATDVNRAYRVLIDPARRFDYDRERRSRGSAVGGDAAFDHASNGGSRATASPTSTSWTSTGAGYGPSRPPLDTRRPPWRAVVLVLVAAAVGVVVLSALTGPTAPRPPDGVLESGSCVTIEPNGDAREVACTGSGDIVVDVLVPFDGRCPQFTVAHRDRQGMGTACIGSAP